jgi:hypothetical protein
MAGLKRPVTPDVRYFVVRGKSVKNAGHTIIDGTRNSFWRCGFSHGKVRRVDGSLSQLSEESVNIARVYLKRSGELGNGDNARFLTVTINLMIRRGSETGCSW